MEPETVKTREVISRHFESERPAIQVALFILWRIQHKKYVIGSRLLSQEVVTHLQTTKASYRDALLFLEGAGVVVNEVVILDHVPKTLVERYGLSDG